MHRRAVRAAGALSAIALAAFGHTGAALAVGTVAESQPIVSLSDTPFGPYAPAEVAGPVAVAVPTAVAAAPAASLAPATATATARVSPTSPDGTGIPSTVLAAYKAAEAALAASNPSCHLPWTLVAGIGRVESGHASGGRVDAAGTTNGRILGPRLDGGTVGTATIRDSDAGALDGDTGFDRAVGPMQFIPGTWKSFAKDGNNDGVVSPHNVFDSAVAAGTYLCSSGGDLSQPAAQRAALLRYNRSDAYGALVLRWAAAYGAGVAVLPNGAGPVPSTAPTPPVQVPAPANGTLDPAAAAALAAPAPAVTGPAASESDAGAVTTTVTATSTPTSTPTTPVTVTTTVTATPSTTTPPTSTKPTTTTTKPTATSTSAPSTPTTPKTTPPTTRASSEVMVTSSKAAEETTSEESTPEEPSTAELRAVADDDEDSASAENEDSDSTADPDTTLDDEDS
jgi:membrane-bound lytic murein transglycosylase B